jgi:hypothetical protein
MEMKAPSIGVGTPKLADGDLPGYKPKPPLFPDGVKSPYVRDSSGMIWHYQPYMDDMGDVLQPCWDAPPAVKVMVAMTADEFEQYKSQTHAQTEPLSGEPRKPRKPRTRKQEPLAVAIERAAPKIVVPSFAEAVGAKSETGPT